MTRPPERPAPSLSTGPLGPLSAAVLVALGGLLLPGPPARASLLGPVLQWMRPQLEQRLTQLCLSVAAGGQSSLERSLQEPCRQLAGPASQCLIREAETSGRSFGVISELVAGRFGDDSEVVVKRCAARLLGLPPDTLKEVPMRELKQRFGRPSGGVPGPPGPAGFIGRAAPDRAERRLSSACSAAAVRWHPGRGAPPDPSGGQAAAPGLDTSHGDRPTRRDRA